MTKLSILMGVHNGAPTLDRAIQSILEQDYLNWECGSSPGRGAGPQPIYRLRRPAQRVCPDLLR